MVVASVAKLVGSMVDLLSVEIRRRIMIIYSIKKTSMGINQHDDDNIVREEKLEDDGRRLITCRMHDWL